MTTLGGFARHTLNAKLLYEGGRTISQRVINQTDLQRSESYEVNRYYKDEKEKKDDDDDDSRIKLWK